MVIGLLFALIVPSAAISYMFIFFSGIFAGRVIYERKNKIVFPFLVIIGGFLIGYLAGMRYGDWIVVVAIFVMGVIIGYHLFNKKILKDLRF